MKEEGNTRTALFVGSFDPFTIGHADIVERTLKLFGRIVIGVGINPEKHCMMMAEERIEAVRSLYEGDNRVKIVGFTDLAVDLAELNRRMAGIETILLYADPTMAAISSSAVRQLTYFHKDTGWMLPKRKKGKE